jgi:hypothetical protein
MCAQAARARSVGGMQGAGHWAPTVLGVAGRRGRWGGCRWGRRQCWDTRGWRGWTVALCCAWSRARLA